MKKPLSLIISFMLAAAAVLGSCMSVFAIDSGNLTATKGAYWFETHEVGNDLTDTFIYDDELLKGDSKEYNQKLATMSFELAAMSSSSERVDYPEKSINLRSFLEDNGFIDFDMNEDYAKEMTVDTYGVACAHKKIVDNGKEYTLLVIAPRAAGYESEWGNNFIMGESGDHEGFSNAREKVLTFTRDYIDKHGIKGDIKVWMASYSRGAGVANLVGASIVDDAKSALGSSVNLDLGNFYCYTYGTPKAAGKDGYEADKYNYIHNIYETYDVVTALPPENFGFGRYGSHYTYADKGDKDRMLKFLEHTNYMVYDLYMNGGDPDGFSPKTIDAEALLGKKEFKIVNDSNSYLPYDQREFMKILEDSMAEAAYSDPTVESNSARVKFVQGGYQAALSDFASYYYSHSHRDEASKIIEGVQGSKFVMPMAASMYISYMLERYSSSISAESKAQILVLEEAMQALLDAAGVDDPEALPDEIRDEYKALADAIEGVKNNTGSWATVSEASSVLSTELFRYVLKEGLDKAGVGTDESIYRIVTADKEARALSRFLAYMLLYDTAQTDNLISFTKVSEQIKHLATFIGNVSSYQRPHNNEVILSWLRTLDSNFDGEENVVQTAAQKSGYRRAYISQPDGVDVTGQVKDENENVVAEFKNGVLTSRTDDWIGITTSDNGNWLRLPADKKYYIDLSVSKETTLNLKMAEWQVYDGKEVRTETSDSKYNWKKLKITPSDNVRWVFEAVPAGSDGEYTLPSGADYYIEFMRTLTFELNGGTMWDETGTVTAEYADGTVIEMPEPERDGYTFRYWKGSKYEAGDEYTVTEDHTFSAVWKKEKSGSDTDTDTDISETDSTSSVKRVDTGDSTRILSWIALFTASLLGCVIVLIMRRKHRA